MNQVRKLLPESYNSLYKQDLLSGHYTYQAKDPSSLLCK